MLTLLAGIAMAMTPFLAIGALLWLSERFRNRREARYARQIALTDALHREVGAATAPIVRKPLGRGWRVSMAVPLDRPATVATIIRVTGRVLTEWEGPGARPFRIVLTPQQPDRRPVAAARRFAEHCVTSAEHRAAEGTEPLAAGLR